ncbi:hypothetical protein GCG54_00015371 [Colletotrichum gloeosporioides]|uniref:Uncharacterized protein n=1 Tax=Colletotrichum gloeosporioides TaxID=474922 RepID=A0A8H4CQI7_COLGL|nr:uncharacterized protein GCG54_00015371 [Colletotrichum gloeosporioides]KAF3807987.1 hypothetical protein GCG54_00015371 [Colletotrichum gloeosporioides]
MIKAFAANFDIFSNQQCRSSWCQATHYIPGGTSDWPAEKIETLMAEPYALKRCATPEEMARVFAFLASDDGGWVNG